VLAEPKDVREREKPAFRGGMTVRNCLVSCNTKKGRKTVDGVDWGPLWEEVKKRLARHERVTARCDLRRGGKKRRMKSAGGREKKKSSGLQAF